MSMCNKTSPCRETRVFHRVTASAKFRRINFDVQQKSYFEAPSLRSVVMIEIWSDPITVVGRKIYLHLLHVVVDSPKLCS